MCVFICNNMTAELISESEAVAIARKFMPEKSFSVRSLSRDKSIPPSQNRERALYAINADGHDAGYVIIDSNNSEVIGYSNKGTIDLDKMPDNAKSWLKVYQIEGDESSDYMIEHKNIDPFIQTKWGQGTPFNDLCPFDDGVKTLSGCFATAMAQILYYYKPVSAAEVLGYKDYESLPPTSFNWETMQLEYDGTETGQSAEAVATLMWYCGHAVKTDYLKSGSFAAFDTNEDVFSEVFGMSKSDQVIRRYGYDTKTWEELIYNELAESRPVLYSGFSPGGHFFVVDGYENRDGKAYFHINFGWNGMADGYYSLSSAGGYCFNQSALVGIQQDHGEDETLRLTIYEDYVSFADPVFYRTDPMESFTGVGVKGIFRSTYYTDPSDVHAGWGLFDGMNLLEVLSDAIININSDYFHGYNQDGELSIGAHIRNGNYSIRQIWHSVGDTEWHLMELANSHYIKAHIEDNNLSLELSSPKVYELTMNSVSYSSPMRRSREWEITANITNNSDRGSEIPVYLFEDDNTIPIYRRCVYAEQGQSEDLVFKYTPRTAGCKLLKFATDYYGEDIFHTETINISDGLKEELSYTIDIKDLDLNSLYNNSLEAIVHIENPWDIEYDDGIRISLSWGENFSERIDSIIPLKLSKGDSYDAVIKMPLEKSMSYSFGVFQFIYYDTYSTWSSVASQFFTCYGAPLIQPLKGDANGDGTVNAADIVEVVNYIKGIPSDKFKIEEADANDDGTVNVADIVSIVNLLQSPNPDTEYFGILLRYVY